MPISAHQIIIVDPAHLKRTIDAMVTLQGGEVEKFALAFTRLLSLFTDYLAVETPPDRRRLVTLWANPHEEQDFFWFIREEPLNARSSDQEVKSILAGGLHYHPIEKVWSINT